MRDQQLLTVADLDPARLPGQRVRLALRDPLRLDSGAEIGPITVAYQTYGRLNAARTNAILVAHALTGDQFAAERHPVTGKDGWWDLMIGPGRPLDTERYFVLCANVLGGCMGTTGPLDTNPATGQPYGLGFPVITIGDMVRVQAMLLDHLGIERLFCVIGGSMGGMQVLEWGVTFPDKVRSLVPIATAPAASAQQIAYGTVGRKAIRLDARWRGGDYYDAEPGDGPQQGLAIARMVAQITYRTDDVFTDRFGREVVEPLDGFSLWQRFQVERYLEYHGDKLARRFDANSYLLLSKAMDLHDVGRGRGGIENAMARIGVPVLSVGIRSDTLYPPYQQQQICEAMDTVGVTCRYVEIDSPHGHDAFLIDLDQVGAALGEFLTSVEKSDP